jgi:hypothetical protein
MEDQKIYNVEFTNHEMNSLNEVLANFRKTYSEVDNPKNHPVFVAAAELNYKIAMILMPQVAGSVTLQDYLEI